MFAVWLWSANSHAWNLCRKQNSALSPQEKITRLLGKSLDQIDEILDIPLAECDPAMLNAKIQVLRVVVLVSAKLAIEHRRSVSEGRGLWGSGR